MAGKDSTWLGSDEHEVTCANDCCTIKSYKVGTELEYRLYVEGALVMKWPWLPVMI